MFEELQQEVVTELDPPVASPWTHTEEKLFEESLVRFSKEIPGRWNRIAEKFSGKSAAEVEAHYNELIEDIFAIECGTYDSSIPSRWDFEEPLLKQEEKRKVKRKKGAAWSKEEHILFLEGLRRYGKGDWKGISRNLVTSRTPTQVASHAQKYFLRQSLTFEEKTKKKKKRSSILDVAMVADQMANPGSVSHPFTSFRDTGLILLD